MAKCRKAASTSIAFLPMAANSCARTSGLGGLNVCSGKRKIANYFRSAVTIKWDAYAFLPLLRTPFLSRECGWTAVMQLEEEYMFRFP